MRKKNALTKYYVAPIPQGNEEPEWLRLARWINTVNDDSEEETEEDADYFGDGTPQTDVVSVKKAYSFEGKFDEEDPAHQFVASKELTIGDDRKILFKQERTNGDVLTGKATISDIKITGGEATEYAPISFKIGWDEIPTVTKATPTNSTP